MNIGILGAGHIAKKMAITANKMDGAAACAVASRDASKAASFAKEYCIEKAYGSYDDMVRDSNIDLVYVATPHSHHYEHMKLCLNNGKHVLCEKAFTLNAAQAEEICALARQKGLLAAEAIWTRYLPIRTILNEVLASGIIGTPSSLTANLCHVVNTKERLVNPALGGGALLDLGVYTINFALMVFGNDIKNITSSAVLFDTGVDAQESMCFIYNDGKMAVLHNSALAKGDRRGMIYGDRGFIEAVNINNCEKLLVYDLEHNIVKTYDAPAQITGFEYEILACQRAIAAGAVECPEMPHAEIIRVMGIMDSLRKQWGVVYPGE
ncbi:Gfo/Idh/MocA family protein [Breznakiella homolactica]|uniref:Gfo/Idh/MocA family oxidoreductase n=1 Tax=Breznakiella homolactica TaxID=2798577 RepID=A0A7T8B9M5_9SPIR|nr:Gfo/Idh/MocA family oxidoreductase [Breznakiella homolactica]QQO08627.1 Gfo/Idh/MocA family oxidoreductase [Breznakiella homolactica]